MKVYMGPYPGAKSKKDRKVKVEIHKYDTWNMDHTLAVIILPMLIQLKKTKHGSPYVDSCDAPRELEDTTRTPGPHAPDECDENVHKRWDWVLDEIIWAFTEIVEGRDGTEFYGKKYKKLSDKERGNLMRDYQERTTKALTLFGKYYRGLWD